MDRNEIGQKVREALAQQLGLDVEEVTLQARLKEDLDTDSLDLVEAVLTLEEAFDLKIPEQEMEGVETVAHAVDLVATKLNVPA